MAERAESVLENGGPWRWARNRKNSAGVGRGRQQRRNSSAVSSAPLACPQKFLERPGSQLALIPVCIFQTATDGPLRSGFRRIVGQRHASRAALFVFRVFRNRYQHI